MDDFPVFMQGAANAISASAQSDGVRGWVYEGNDGKQMAYWRCEKDGVSGEHTHDYDEYFIVVQGIYTLLIEGEKIVLRQGDEYCIPRGVPHAGEFHANTRTIHCFGGPRASTD